MNISDFRVEPADYRADYHDLLTVRQSSAKPSLPEASESISDSPNPQSVHFIARDHQHRPIGAVGLSADGNIESLTVIPEWQHRGAEQALLTALIDKAARLGFTGIKAHAAQNETTIYTGLNFIPVAQNDQGAHLLSLTLEPVKKIPSRPSAKPVPESMEPVKLDNPDSILNAGIRLVSSARRQIRVISKDLEWPLYAQNPLIEALKSFAIGNKNSLVLILIQEPSALIGKSHPLIDLAQRLPSSFQLRTPVELEDIDYPSAMLLGDQRGYLFRINAEQAQGDWSPCLPSRTKQLTEIFERLWQRSRPCTEFRVLNL